MKKISFRLSRVLCVGLLSGALSAHAAEFTLRSPELKPQQTLPSTQVFNGFGCHGENLSPALTWSHAPAGTQSFAVTVYDPDAPTGSGWWHWVVYDIPADAAGLPSAAVVQAALPGSAKQARNDFGVRDFGGACPPPGDKPHRYIFTVHALKVAKLDVPEDASPALVGYMLTMNRLGKAGFTAYYGR